jgi:DNA uptake protein ComE-like DNA-binding protein
MHEPFRSSRGGFFVANQPTDPTMIHGAAEDGEKLIIDLNTADEDTLAGFENVGNDRARALIAHRPYKNWDEVRKVPGIGPEVVDILSLGGVQIGQPQAPDERHN